MTFRKVKPKVRKVSKGPRWRLFGGDCLETLKRLKSDSVDVLVTDPPYGIKFMGRDWDKALPPVAVWRECVRVLKPGSFGFVMSSARQDCLARMILNLEAAGFVIDFTSIYWTYSKGMNKGTAMDKLIDKRFGAERKIVGKNPTWRETKRTQVKYGRVGGESAKFITEATTDEAKCFVGANPGFNPKPAVEVVIAVMKPLSERTYVDQALTNGKGVTWLSDCRIPASDMVRMPSSLLDSDEVLNECCDSYSRYFSLDAWAKERLPKKVAAVWPWLIVSKPEKREKNHEGRVQNKHKTVKPIQLMSYLVTLGSRPGGWVLDPYCGSGSTGVAAVILNRRFIGCELDEQWVQLSKDRISDAQSS